MSLLNAVNPSNDAFGGGTLARAGRPTAVGGSFTSAGAASTPTNPGVPAVLSARNNRGSNVRIPYARVVPLHNSDPLDVTDKAPTGTGRTSANEYDGLETAELAWVLGKSFPTGNMVFPLGTNFAAHAPQPPDNLPSNVAAGRPGPVAADGSARIQANAAGMGFGPDRMQRLAYTAWVEAHIEQRVGTATIDLGRFDPFSDTCSKLDSELAYWGTLGGLKQGANMLAMPDIAYALQTEVATAGVPAQVAKPMMQGLFVMERGPFLRSIGTNHRPIEVAMTSVDAAGNLTRLVPKHHVDRHLGSDLAQKALECALKLNGLMNWVPDGICLSKYETGPNSQADAAIEARMSQLFNIGVQGPCITKTWTGDAKMQCMPGDKVFMLIVGNVHYKLGAKDANTSFVDTQAGLTKAMKAAASGLGPGGAPGPAPKGRVSVDELAAGGGFFDAAQANVTKRNALPAAASTNYEQTFAAWRTAKIDLEAKLNPNDGDRRAVADAWTAHQKTIGIGATAAENKATDLLDGFDEKAAALRSGETGVVECKVSGMRLMRATSSFLAQYSHYHDLPTSGGGTGGARDPRESRLGLPIFYDGANDGAASYVLGGWCIGTVHDSAASRSAVNNTMRTAPASMALNVDVNVSWWSADSLYQHYMDSERYTTAEAEGDLVQLAEKVAADAESALLTADGKPIPPTLTAASAYTAKTTAELTLSRRTKTVATRDIRLRATSSEFSPDLDTEAFDDAARPANNRSDAYKRVWTGAMP